jgi:hypothetical protein
LPAAIPFVACLLPVAAFLILTFLILSSGDYGMIYEKCLSAVIYRLKKHDEIHP